MKNIRLSLAPLALIAASVLAVPSVTPALAGEPLQPLPKPKDLPGSLQFHGRYQHRSRGADIAQPSELWVSRKPEGGVVALTHLPWTGCTELVSGDKENRLEEFRLRAVSENKPGYGMDLKFSDSKALISRRGVRQDLDGKELTVPAGACFDPNSRPDSYCAANILLRQFCSGGTAQGKEFRVYDWDSTGEALADYRIKLELKGKETVKVPAGSFEASHFVLTQTSSANTWFKKRAGHTTDFWVLENGVIVRILRSREPYELLLLDYDVPARLPGLQ